MKVKGVVWINKMSEKQPQNLKLPLSHAYLFSGNDEKAKNGAIEFLLSRFLEEKHEHSPDLFRLASNPITIDDVRALKIKASQSPLAGEFNVFLIESIENLSREAAAAMLKLLEEPPSRSVIIATTANTRAILPTIKSRLSAFRFWKKEPLTQSMAAAEANAKSKPTQNNVSKLEKLLAIHKVLGDPTINKRLLGEYLNMIK